MTSSFLRRLRRRWEPRGEREGPRFVYVSYHKCATQFAELVVRAVCEARQLRVATFDSRHPQVDSTELARTDFLLLTDYSSAMIDLDTLSARGVHAIRDPRDTLVSMYFSHRSSHPLNHEEIARDRAVLAGLDVEAGLHYLMEESQFFQRIVRELGTWDFEGRGYFETRFERLTTVPAEEFAAMFEFLGLDVGLSELAAILERNRFSALQQAWSANHPKTEGNHYRRGQPGDWRVHLVGGARESFRERYGPLLVQLGYEANLAW